MQETRNPRVCVRASLLSHIAYGVNILELSLEKTCFSCCCTILLLLFFWSLSFDRTCVSSRSLIWMAFLTLVRLCVWSSCIHTTRTAASGPASHRLDPTLDDEKKKNSRLFLNRDIFPFFFSYKRTESRRRRRKRVYCFHPGYYYYYYYTRPLFIYLKGLLSSTPLRERTKEK